MNTSNSLKNSHSQGFALIATISVMVLLVMVALAMLSLSTIELRSSQRGQAMEDARANARMALMIAIGELQKTAGPDQRITANSAIVGDSAKQKQILGVWTSISQKKDSSGNVTQVSSLSNALNLDALSNEYKASYDNGEKARDDRFLRWLVSGIPTDVGDVDYPESELPSDESVDLVGEHSLGLTSPLTAEQKAKMLQARLVELNEGGQARGAYAWGVMGENLKARVNLKHEENSSVSEQLAARAASPVTGIQALVPSSIDSTAPDVGSEYVSSGKVKSDLDKVPTSNTLALAGNSSSGTASLAENWKYYTHDISTVSSGLLTNAKWGGWKKDLNLLCEIPQTARPDAFKLPHLISGGFAAATREQQVFSGPLAGSADEMTHGPVWADLIDYMNVYKPLGAGGHLSWSGDVPAYSMGTNWGDVNQSRTWRATMPVMTKSIWYLSLKKVTRGADSYVVVVVQPVVEFWNPYNVPLRVPDGLVLKLNHQELRLNLEATASGQPTVNKSLRQLFNGIDGYAVNLAGVEIPAGETVYFSDSQPSREVGRWSVFQMQPGIPSLDGGVYFLQDTNSEKSYLFKNFTGTQVNLKMPYSAGTAAWINNNYELYKAPATSWGDVLAMLNENMVFGVFPDKKIMGQYTTSRSINVGSTPELFFMGGVMLRDEFGPNQSSPADPNEVSDYEKALIPHWQFSALSMNKYTLKSNAAAGGTDIGHTTDLSPYVFFGRTVSGNNNNLQVRASDFGANADGGYRGRASGLGTSSLVSGSSNVVFREFPIQPLTSMMQLQHSGLGDYIIKPSFNHVGNVKMWSTRYSSFPTVNFAFGNSFNNPFVSNDSIDGYGLSPMQHNSSLLNTGFHDKSWKANESLWDQWFMSGVGQWNRNMDSGSGNTTNTLAMINALTSGSESSPFPYVRYKGNVKDQDLAEADLISGSNVTSDAYEKLAQYIYSEGAFNVNSTSVYAWKALLAGADLTARDFKFLSPGMISSASWETDSSLSSDSKYTFSRFTTPSGSSVQTSQVNSNRDRRWLGTRSLSDDELGVLAEKIVDQVKARGPFLSLSEFMNRALKGYSGQNNGHVVRGAIQAAIYESGINESVKNDSHIVDKSLLSYQNYPNEDAMGDYDKNGSPQNGFTARGAPGFLTQADVLTGVSPALTVRCDTFTVRAYGETRNTNGDVIARAWAEAVVQRTPEYIDDAGDAAGTVIVNNDGSMNSLTSSANIKFGRKMKIISFRWLNQDEI